MMMTENNYLIVIENEILKTYSLDKMNVWEFGRENADIIVEVNSVSREHGRFRCMDGIWFYVDKISNKNGTFYNKRKIVPGANGRIKPILLKSGDIFIFGARCKAKINNKTVWAMFINDERYRQLLSGDNNNLWRDFDSKNLTELTFEDGENVKTFKQPEKGMVIKGKSGIAIYMDEKTYLLGEMKVTGV